MKKVLLLEGGTSSEREGSFDSAKYAKEVLKAYGKYDFSSVEFNDKIDINKVFIENRPDVVFNCLHGETGEDGKLQGMLDILHIPYTHSGLLASAIGMNKFIAEQICKANGIKTAKSIKVRKDEVEKADLSNFKYPVIIKPNDQGSSIGVELCEKDFKEYIKHYDWQTWNEILVEEFIEGKEFSVTVTDDFVFDASYITCKHKFLDAVSKESLDLCHDNFNHDLSKEKHQELKDLAKKVYHLFGCKDIGRMDFILSKKDNMFYFLEINTTPGLVVGQSTVPLTLEHEGYSLLDLCVYLIENATYDGNKNKKQRFKLQKIKF